VRRFRMESLRSVIASMGKGEFLVSIEIQDAFLEMLENNKRLASPVATNGQSPSSGSQSPVVPINSGSPDSSGPGTPLQIPTTVPASPPLAVSPLPPALDVFEVSGPSPCTVSSPPLSQPPQQKRGFMSRLFGSSTPESPPAKPAEIPSLAERPMRVQSVEDFVPEDSLDRSFLEDSSTQRDLTRASLRQRRDSDSDTDNDPNRCSVAVWSLESCHTDRSPATNDAGNQGKHRPVQEECRAQRWRTDSCSDGDAPGTNPMVAGFQDDLDPDDRIAAKSSLAVIPSKNITLSSDDEDTSAPVHIARDEDIDTELFSWKPTQPSAPQTRPEKQDTLPTSSQSIRVKKSKAKAQEDSDSDPEGPIAKQMLSFVMDDPDFDSEDSNQVSKTTEDFPVLNNMSESSSEETSSVPTQPVKSAVTSFKMRQASDLFGLGFDENVIKDGEEDKESNVSKEKKKKKKKTKEAPEEDKSTKKKTKHKKSKEKEKEEGKDEKKKKPKKGKEKKEIDELEAFLGGGEPSKPSSGGEYEEL
ncbi:unnamed protein product, partial [Ranitomeya imitator]